MQERSNGYANGDHTKDKIKKWFISRSVGMMFSGVFRGKKSVPTSSSMRVSQMLKSEDIMCHSFKRLLEIENEEQKKAIVIEKNKKRSKTRSLSLSRFFHKKSFSSFNCMRGKMNKIDINSNRSTSTSTSFSSTRTSFYINSQSSSGRTSEIMIGRQSSRCSLPRVPSRILTTRHKLKMAHSLTKMGSMRKSAKEDRDECQSLISIDGESKLGWEYRDGGVELCKKRILMGGKCKPLNNLGTLQYDNDGILLPDIIQ